MHWLLLGILFFGFADSRWDFVSGRGSGRRDAPATVVDNGGTATAMDGSEGEPPPPPPKP